MKLNENIDGFFFNATFNNISAISWQPVLVVEEVEVPGENHRPWANSNNSAPSIRCRYSRGLELASC